MDPSICRLHPGVAVTGFCPACLRDRLAGLHPPSAADLRRCKSFSYARSAASLEPQRRSCDLFRGPPIGIAAAAAEDLHHQQAPKSSRSLGGLLGKKLQQWRRKSKKEEDHQPRVPALARPSTTMLSLPVEAEEDDDDDCMNTMEPPPVPRSDGQIPVEEDYNYGYDCSYYGNAAVPGGSSQTRDYYLDSSSSSRRRRSVDRSTTSGRNSFSDASSGLINGELPLPGPGGNARVSPAMAAERPLYHHYHHEAQSVLVHHHQQQQHYCRDEDGLRVLGDDFSRSFGSAFRGDQHRTSKPKKGIKGWSIWGLIHKKQSSKSSSVVGLHANGPPFSSPAGQQAVAAAGEHPWPELRARGYNGQMLRCNSSISARSSFSGGASSAMIGGSGRRSISGVDMRDGKNNAHHGHGGLFESSRRTVRRDEVLLDRNMMSTRSSSYSRSSAAVTGHDLDPPMAMAMAMQYHHHSNSSRPPNIPRRSSSSSRNEFSSLPRTRRSMLGL
ncbi:hypothetical protein BS78_05G290900 [Paspalum vaginatum]|nr:hypothetical protein BS78_05G290900 [Paspalum vaginatum]